MTIRHLVLFRLNDGVSAHDPRVREAVAASAELRESVPGGESWRIGSDVSGRDVAADFAGVGDFTSREVLAQYLADPRHQEAARLWSRVGTVVIADLDWPSRP